MFMHVNGELSGVPGYVSIKEAADMLGLSPSRVYEYVEDGRLSSVRAAHVILIPVDEVKNFKPGIAGRPRKSMLRWRISPGNNVLLSTSIVVQIRTGSHAQLMTKLDEMRRADRSLFPGTVARFIVQSDTFPGQVEISLIWRSSAMPDAMMREQVLNEFREALADVLDWETAQYNEGHVLMHT
jgi:excisionase family DNA binding protein